MSNSSSDLHVSFGWPRGSMEHHMGGLAAEPATTPFEADVACVASALKSVENGRAVGENLAGWLVSDDGDVAGACFDVVVVNITGDQRVNRLSGRPRRNQVVKKLVGLVSTHLLLSKSGSILLCPGRGCDCNSNQAGSDHPELCFWIGHGVLPWCGFAGLLGPIILPATVTSPLGWLHPTGRIRP